MKRPAEFVRKGKKDFKENTKLLRGFSVKQQLK